MTTPDPLVSSLLELSQWMRSHTGPKDGTHEMLVRAVEAMKAAGIDIDTPVSVEPQTFFVLKHETTGVFLAENGRLSAERSQAQRFRSPNDVPAVSNGVVVSCALRRLEVGGSVTPIYHYSDGVAVLADADYESHATLGYATYAAFSSEVQAAIVAGAIEGESQELRWKVTGPAPVPTRSTGEVFVFKMPPRPQKPMTPLPQPGGAAQGRKR